MKRAVIFAGAGASKAVNPEQFPTTVEFFNKLPEDIRQDRIFRFVEGFLLRTDETRIIDIEEILWEMQRLSQFITDIEDRSTLIGYSLYKDTIIRMLFGNSVSSGHLSAAFSQTKAGIDTLTARINETVYDFYSYEPQDEELEDNWVSLLRTLEAEFLIDIFTTNYDLAIESAVSITGIEAFDEYLGISGRVQKHLNIQRWIEASPNDTRLTKLHGSINWQRRSKDVLVGASLYTGDHKRHAIIYPGFKGEPEAEIFRPLHTYLGKRLYDADLALFIGFGFRDDYINQLIGEYLNPDCSVVVINPDKRVIFPGPRRPVNYIRAGFDTKTIRQAVGSTSTSHKRRAKARI